MTSASGYRNVILLACCQALLLTNAVTLITEDDEQVVPLQSKSYVAARILDRVEALLRSRTANTARA